MTNNQLSEALIANLRKTTGLKFQEKRVRNLLVQGADPNYVDIEGSTPMTYAGSISVSVLAALLEAGADPNATDSIGFPALSLAAMSGKVDNATLLLQAGANPNMQINTIGSTALMSAIQQNSNNGPIVQLLIDAGANLNIQDIHGYTAIMYAAVRGDLNYFTMLYLAGADLTLVNNDGKSVHDLATAEMRRIMQRH